MENLETKLEELKDICVNTSRNLEDSEIASEGEGVEKTKKKGYRIPRK